MKIDYTIQKMPLMERPREKALQYGVEYLSDAELMAIILGKGTAGRSALYLAHLIFQEFGDWRRISTYSVRELQRIKGIGEIKALELKACLEIARRFQRLVIKPGDFLNGSKNVFLLYHERLRDYKKEHFFALLLDCKHCMIREELVSIGSLNLSIVHPREVFAPAIRESAESLILVHNHPSGNPQPSQEDLQVTSRLVKVGKLVGIEVLDHIIIGNGDYVSFAESNLL